MRAPPSGRACKQFRRNFHMKHAEEFLRMQKYGRRASKGSRRSSKSRRSSSLSTTSFSQKELEGIAAAERKEQARWNRICEFAARPPQQPAWNAGPNWRPPCERHRLRSGMLGTSQQPPERSPSGKRRSPRGSPGSPAGPRPRTAGPARSSALSSRQAMGGDGATRRGSKVSLLAREAYQVDHAHPHPHPH